MEQVLFQQFETSVSDLQIEESKKISDSLLEISNGIQFNMIAFDQN